MFLLILLALIFGAAPGARPQDARLQGTFHTVIGAAGTAESSVTSVRRAVELGLDDLKPSFPGVPARAFRVFVHETAASLPRDVRDWLHEGAPGVALLEVGDIHLILAEIDSSGPSTLQSVVEHELVHILLHQYAGPGGAFIPRWVHEGLAQDLSGARYLGAREEDLIGPARFGTLPSLGSLEKDFRREEFRLRQAYAQSFSFVAYLGRELGHEAMLEIARASGEDRGSGEGLGFSRAFVRKTGRAVVFYEDKWIDYLENESGAAERVVLQNCFSYLMILAAPVLALAVIRRLARDRRVREKLAAAEDPEEGESPPG